MAATDYRLCDLCNCKTFYDSGLPYDFRQYPDTGLDRVGEWKVICRDCAQTHTIVILCRDDRTED